MSDAVIILLTFGSGIILGIMVGWDWHKGIPREEEP